jgi:hypothetical protein
MQVKHTKLEDVLPDRSRVAHDLMLVAAMGAPHAHELGLGLARFGIDFPVGKLANYQGIPGRRVGRHGIDISRCVQDAGF